MLPSTILLTDVYPDLVAAWICEFAGIEGVEPLEGDYFERPADALVSPANSFGIMDGGLDLLIRNQLLGVQATVQEAILRKHYGEIPVGYAEVVATNDDRWPFLICAPTMRVPENVSTSINSYLSFRATLLAISRHNAETDQRIKSVVVPGFGTGIGGMNPERCARQMRLAYDSVYGGARILNPREIHQTNARLRS